MVYSILVFSILISEKTHIEVSKGIKVSVSKLNTNYTYSHTVATVFA